MKLQDMISRELESQILQLAMEFQVVALIGPRQSGKTTLAKKLFGAKYKYVTLEDIDEQAFAKNDPRAFLEQFRGGVIIDEAQNVPELFSYIQGIVDENDLPGEFILTGSQNFLLSEKISQSLAGRVAIVTLLPLSLSELKRSNHEFVNVEEMLFKGFYPSVYQRERSSSNWYRNYLKTYIERDVRQLKNIQDLTTFQTFIKMCASRAGQLFDITSLGNDCGISNQTVKEWLNILEVSYITFSLRPYYKNYNKRLVKAPKLYFYDTGLLCHLLGIENPDQLRTHLLRGGIFESFVISEIMKNQMNQYREPHVYFWRDSNGNEIDCIIENGRGLIPIEIKSAKTLNSDFFTGLKNWCSLTGSPKENAFLVYGGNTNQKRTDAQVISWKNVDLITKLDH